MAQTEVVRKWFGQKLYINGSDRSCTEMVRTEVVRKWFGQKLYINGSDRSFT